MNKLLKKFFKDNKQNITVTLKLYSGLEKSINTKYNPDTGLQLKTKNNIKIIEIAKMLNLPDKKNLVSFCNGERVSLSKKLSDGDEISLFKPSGGG